MCACYADMILDSYNSCHQLYNTTLTWFRGSLKYLRSGCIMSLNAFLISDIVLSVCL